MARKASRELWADFLKRGRTAARAEVATLRAGPSFRGLVLGVDPSLRGTGLAVIEAGGGGQLRLHYSETLRLARTYSFYECLGRISARVEEVLQEHSVDHVALEQTIYVQNLQTAQILGAARGAAIAPAARSGRPVFEYAPLRVKQAVVGFGRASKEQLGATLQQIMGLTAALPLDESDAAGVAVCHAFTHRGREK